MKFKRFKTLLLEYIDQIPELDDVEWVYYMDIDVMMGAPLAEMLQSIEETYQIGEEDPSDQISKLYMFKNTPEARMKFVANSGFIIMNRVKSRHCLDLWRMEIDSNPRAEFDQTSLNAIARKSRLGKEVECQLVSMELENFVSYPSSDTALNKMVTDSSYTNLIHILNSWKANRIGANTTEHFVINVLQLSEEEQAEHKLGKAVISSADEKKVLMVPVEKPSLSLAGSNFWFSVWGYQVHVQKILSVTNASEKEGTTGAY